MFRTVLLAGLVALATPAFADDLPTANDCYQTATNAQDIDAYMACFTDDAVVIDVSLESVGQDATPQSANCSSVRKVNY
ncbi:hypothetical protein [uncultured Aliiroseovarius sp.]|uniref:hypothetical protein n=1 Tax=uncultured Aliiroseovarius sp. TaxID=1658783 RepID=UPI002618E6ED|nr:hypothetical protein [uncultured Aliiroseovarius sp.]